MKANDSKINLEFAALDHGMLIERLRMITDKNLDSLQDAEHAVYIPNHGCFSIKEKYIKEIFEKNECDVQLKVVGCKDIGAHLKFEPAHPLNEVLMFSLDRLLFGNQKDKVVTVVSQTVLLKSEGFINKALATQTVYGNEFREALNINQASVLGAITNYNFSRLFVLDLLTKPKDAKTDNFIVDSIGKLISIDNEDIFAPEVLECVKGKGHATYVANVLFLLDKMSECLNSEICERIAKLDVEETMFKLLHNIHCHQNPQDRPDEWQVEASFPEGVIFGLYNSLKALKKLCIRHSDVKITNSDVMQLISPQLFSYYEGFQRKCDLEDLSLEDRVNILIAQGGSNKKYAWSFEALEIPVPKSIKIKTEFELHEEKRLTLRGASEEFVNSITYKDMIVSRKMKIFKGVINYLSNVNILRINNCTLDRKSLLSFSKLPLVRLILDNVEVCVEDLDAFMRRRKVELLLHNCAGLKKDDWLHMNRNHPALYKRVELSLLESTKIQICPVNEIDAGNYMYQVHSTIKSYGLERNAYLKGIYQYLIVNKFYLHSLNKLFFDYSGGGIDDFVEHTIFSIVQQMFQARSSAEENVGIYKLLHVRHRKLYRNYVIDTKMVSNERYREDLVAALDKFDGQKKLLDIQIHEGLSKLEEVNQGKSQLVKIYNRQCEQISRRITVLVDRIRSTILDDTIVDELGKFISEINAVFDHFNAKNYYKPRSFSLGSRAYFSEVNDKIDVYYEKLNCTIEGNRLLDMDDFAYDAKNLKEKMSEIVRANKMLKKNELSAKAIPSVLKSEIVARQKESIENTIYDVINGVKLDFVRVPYHELKQEKLAFVDAYGRTYLGRYCRQKVLIKEFDEKKIEKAKKYFMHEIKVRAGLRHKNIVEIIGGDLSNDQFIIVLDVASSTTLKQYLAKNLLSDAQKISLARDVACGIEYLHSKGVVHGDISSDNIIIDEAGRALLNNFGLSVNSNPTSVSCLFSEARAINYYAPECFRNGRFMRTKLTDTYSFGILLCELFSAQGQYLPSACSDISGGVCQKYVPETVRSLIRQCIHQDPMMRPDFDQLFDCIDQYQPIDVIALEKDIKDNIKLNNLIVAKELAELAAKLGGSFKAYTYIGWLEFNGSPSNAREMVSRRNNRLHRFFELSSRQGHRLAKEYCEIYSSSCEK